MPEKRRVAGDGVLITSAKSAAKAHEYATLPGWITGNSNMNADRRREVVDMTLEALRHTVGRDEHMPFLKQLVERQIGPVTFAEIADGLASIDVSGHDPEWREVWQIQSGGRPGGNSAV